MSEREADIVMLGIEQLMSQITNEDSLSLRQRMCREMLNHLYELHKHRDCEVYNELCYLIVKESLPIYSQLWNALAEMQTC